MLMVLVEWCGFGVLPSTAIAFSAGALLVYALAVRLAFSKHQLTNRRAELVLFVLVGCGGLLVTLAVMWLGVEWLRLDYRLCKIAAAGCSFFFNYAARKALLF
jgi:putative flippase GtrA